VGDERNHRVQVFDSQGNFIRKWGSYGSGDGQFANPLGIALDQVGRVYVTDYDNTNTWARVQIFDSEGNWISKWGMRGMQPGQFMVPQNIITDTYGDMFWVMVSDQMHRVQVFELSYAPCQAVGSSDFQGNGRSELAIFKPREGRWALAGNDGLRKGRGNSFVDYLYWGREGDIMVPGDYTGDGTSQVGIYRPSTGLWGIRNITRTYYGRDGDEPVGSDYNGDGAADIGIFRNSSGMWALRGQSRFYFGRLYDESIPADYSGDGTAEPAIFRSTDGLWAIRGQSRFYFGREGDEAIPYDYDGDGSVDIAVFRESTGLWAVRGLTREYYGETGDIPVVGDYTGDGELEISIVRESGSWLIWWVADFPPVYMY
jgi:hypothetical protein